MATAPTALIAIDDYLKTVYRPDREYVDGELQERNVGEFEHNAIQGELIFWFRSRREEWQIWVVPEQRTQVSQTRVRVPDVSIFALSAAREPVRVTPPLAAIEILSPEDRLSRTTKVMEDYLKMGVEHLWIVDPEQRHAYTYTAAGLLKAQGNRLEIPSTPIYLELSTFFSILD